MEIERIRTADRREDAFASADPWNHGSIVQPDHKLHPHPHLAGKPLDNPDDDRMPFAGRHKIHEPHPAVISLKFRL
jgi:hypothetical protein